MRLFLHTPRLRGVVALSLSSAAGGAMVFVNTVVIVQSTMGLSQQATAWALAAFGLGSITAAIALPPLLSRLPDRTVLIIGASFMTLALVLGSGLATTYGALLALWALMGVGYSMTLTPVGRVLRRSSQPEDRPALFAAQFALSHGCWLIAYPVAGFVSANAGIDEAFIALAGICAAGAFVATLLWPAHEAERIVHHHNDLPVDHPHIVNTGGPHGHEYVIDDLHPRWPKDHA